MLGCCQKGTSPSGVSSQERVESTRVPRVVRQGEGGSHHWCSARSPQVNLLVPAAYLVFWAFLLIFSFISEPMVCGIGVIIILTGVPIFFLGVFWRSKPKCVHRLTGELGSLPQVPGLQMGLFRGFALEQGLPAAVLATQGQPPQLSPHDEAQVSGTHHKWSSSLRTPVPRIRSQGPSVCLSVLRVNDTLGAGAVFRGLPPGHSRGGGERPLPALPTALRGQALEDTMRHLWSLKQLFLFTCCLLRRCFGKKVVFPGKKEFPLLAACNKEVLRCGLGPLPARPCRLFLKRSMNKTGLVVHLSQVSPKWA